VRALALGSLLLVSAVAGATDITFTDLCPGAARVERSKVDPLRVEIYCVGETTPRLVLPSCPAPAQITTRGADKTIRCPGGGLPIVIKPR
jgi:hypothetical protein